MTLKELRQRVTISECETDFFQPVSYKVEIVYRGKHYSFTTDDKMTCERAIDPSKADNWATRKQAYQYLYDQCKKKNGLK